MADEPFTVDTEATDHQTADRSGTACREPDGAAAHGASRRSSTTASTRLPTPLQPQPGRRDHVHAPRAVRHTLASTPAAGGLCGGLHGHIASEQRRAALRAQGSLRLPWLAISSDGGTTWSRVQVSKQIGIADIQSAVAVDSADNLYYTWWDDVHHLPYLSVSRDHGQTWSTPADDRAAGVQEVKLPDDHCGRRRSHCADLPGRSRVTATTGRGRGIPGSSSRRMLSMSTRCSSRTSATRATIRFTAGTASAAAPHVRLSTSCGSAVRRNRLAMRGYVHGSEQLQHCRRSGGGDGYARIAIKEIAARGCTARRSAARAKATASGRNGGPAGRRGLLSTSSAIAQASFEQ